MSLSPTGTVHPVSHGGFQGREWLTQTLVFTGGLCLQGQLPHAKACWTESWTQQQQWRETGYICAFPYIYFKGLVHYQFYPGSSFNLKLNSLNLYLSECEEKERLGPPVKDSNMYRLQLSPKALGNLGRQLLKKNLKPKGGMLFGFSEPTL